MVSQGAACGPLWATGTVGITWGACGWSPPHPPCERTQNKDSERLSKPDPSLRDLNDITQTHRKSKAQTGRRSRVCGPTCPQSHGGTWFQREGRKEGNKDRQTDRKIYPGPTSLLSCRLFFSFDFSSWSGNLFQPGRFASSCPAEPLWSRSPSPLHCIPGPLLFSLYQLPG